MNRLIGLTGGIGSGKSTVARWFEQAGLPVYYADIEAKAAYRNPEIREAFSALFGAQWLTPDGIDAKAFGAWIFDQPQALQQLNALIHPFVKKHFEQWRKQHALQPWVVKEAAILFETDGHLNCDVVITVTAPVELRWQRVQQRDQMEASAFWDRVHRQWPDEQKIAQSDYVIENIDRDSAFAQFQTILNSLLNR